jgi:N-methylhydantoinase A
VASHATAVRAIDVHVVGVAGGSMIRLGRRHVHAVGPRSAHIAGLPYVCFLEPDRLEGAGVELIAPRPGDPADHLVARLADGTAAALTVTCAANALGIVHPGDYAAGSGDAARRAFDLAGRRCGLTGDRLAAEVLAAAGEAVCDVVWDLIHRQRLRSPRLVAVGGGAGGLGRHVAEMLQLPIDIPAGAEVISSIGDALAHVRTEHERTVSTIDATIVHGVVDQVESEARRAGAAEDTIEVRVEEHPERATIRAIATGALEIDADDGRPVADKTTIAAARPSAEVTRRGSFWITRSGAEVAVLDRYGEPIIRLKGEAADVDDLAATYQRLTRYRGPVTLRPTIVHVTGNRVCELSSLDALTVAGALHISGGDETYLVGRPT